MLTEPSANTHELLSPQEARAASRDYGPLRQCRT